MASKTVESALHDYSHQTIRDCSKGGWGCTEFSGLSYQKQMEKINKGKKLLEDELDTKITIFIPPWNSYDINTLRCLEKLGFDCISASLRGPSGKNSHLKFLPVTSTIPKLKQAVNLAKRSSEPYPVIVVLFHAYEFVEISANRGKFTYQDFSNLLSYIISQKDILVSSMGELSKQNGFGTTQFQENHRLLFLSQLLPPLLLNNLISGSSPPVKAGVRAISCVFRFMVCYRHEINKSSTFSIPDTVSYSMGNTIQTKNPCKRCCRIFGNETSRNKEVLS